MATFDDVLGAAQGLAPSDRIRLIDALWETVPPDDWPPPSRQWIAEAQRRSAEYDAAHARANLEFSGGRIQPPEQVADTVLWLCSDEAAAVNGQALLVYGRYGADPRLGSHQHWVPLDELVPDGPP